MRVSPLLLCALLLGCHQPTCDQLGLCWPSAAQTATITRMPVLQAPAYPPTYPAGITPPYDADPLSAGQLRTDVETPLQNGVEAARIQGYGVVTRRRVNCTSNTVLTIQPLGSIAVTVGGVWTVLRNYTPTTINPSALVTLAAATRYWVYASSIAGALTFVVSTVAPDLGSFYSSAPSTDLMYISTFWVGSDSNIVIYTQDDNQYVYSTASTGNIFANGLTGTATIAAGGSLPSMVSSWAARYTFVILGAGLSNLKLFDLATEPAPFEIQGATSDIFSGEVSSTQQAMKYIITDGTGTGDVSLWVKRFTL